MSEQAGQAAPNDMATFKYGVQTQPTPFVGRTVGECRSSLKNAWDIPDDAQAYIGKQALEDDYVVKPGDEITFHKRMGEKG